MGGRGGRGAALTAALRATLAQVARIMADARGPWWVIGSAAVALHGGASAPRDVDILLTVEDIAGLADGGLLTLAEPDGDALFRSTHFAVSAAASMPMEFMAGFAVRIDGAWQPVWPGSRQAVATGGGPVFVPCREELRAILLQFGRDKDRARAAML